MTHLYTLLVGGTVLPGGGRPEVTAIAWAKDLVLVLGTDAAAGAMSRGDSTIVELAGAFVTGLEDGTLEEGAPADLAVFGSDPRAMAGLEPMAIVRGGRVVDGALPGPNSRGGRFGRSTADVEWLLDSLRDLAPAEWKTLQDAHAGAGTTDEAEETLASLLEAEALRDVWFELRHEAAAVAKSAAVDYATATHEGIRTIEHVAAVNAWDGQRETSKVEVLGPAHELAFVDAAAGALGVAMMRAYVAHKVFDRFWQPYQPVFGRPPGAD